MMNAKRTHLLTVLLFNLALISNSFGQDNIESHVQQIRSEIENIKSDSSKFRMEEKSFPGYSSEGGVIKKYFDDNPMRMIDLTVYGETGQSFSRFFVTNGKLIYLSVTEERYKMPLYMGKPEIRSVEENQYYFKDQKLIRWLKNRNTIVEPSSYIEKQIEIMLYFQGQILPDKPLSDNQ